VRYRSVDTAIRPAATPASIQSPMACGRCCRSSPVVDRFIRGSGRSGRLPDEHRDDLPTAVAFAGPCDAGQDLSQEIAIVRVEASLRLAVRARRAGVADRRITEIAQNRRAQASARRRIFDHALELLVLDRFPTLHLGRVDVAGRASRLLAPRAVNQELPRRHVGRVPEERRRCGTAITAGATDLLIVRFDGAWNREVHDGVDIGTIDAHPERIRCTHDTQGTGGKRVLHRVRWSSPSPA
jgi:hypothetical protein